LNPSKPPSQTKFLLQGRFSVKLMYRKWSLPSAQRNFLSMYVSSMVHVLHI
jgi:hypothetical protein